MPDDAADFVSADQPLGEVMAGVSVFATSLESARMRIARRDDYLLAQSAFDRQARMGVPAAALDVTIDIFAAYLQTQVVGWSDEEVAALRSIVAAVANRFVGLGMSLPADIHLLKTTGREEGAAAYTRGRNVIVLPAGMVATVMQLAPGGDSLHPSVSTSYLEDILTHEFFHLFSKNNPDARARLYAGIGYRSLPNAVLLPDVDWAGKGSMPSLKITNPDAPTLNVAIDLVPPGAPGGEPQPMTPILMSSEPYSGGVFFDTLGWYFLEIETDAAGTWVARTQHGKPVVHPHGALLEQYCERVGRNFAEEIFHPDEILAQSFVVTCKYTDLARLAGIRGSLWPVA
jgi:hypothetical protein